MALTERELRGKGIGNEENEDSTKTPKSINFSKKPPNCRARTSHAALLSARAELLISLLLIT